MVVVPENDDVGRGHEHGVLVFMHICWPHGTASTHREGWGRYAYQDTAGTSVCFVSTLSEGAAGWELRRY